MTNKVFSKNDFDIFCHLVKLSQDQMQHTMSCYLRGTYGEDKVTTTKFYTYAIGDIPIALIAHMDTVHSEPPVEIFFDREADCIWTPWGLGADDRAGIFAILKIVASGLRPHIILTRDEEIGAIGATMLAKKECPFPDLKYLIQLDRRGVKDSVYYDCNNQAFEDYINSFGFETNLGTFSDISMICPVWEIAGVNLSVGYFSEHTQAEHLRSGLLLNTIDKVKKMLTEQNIPYFKFVPYPVKNTFRKGPKFFSAYDKNYGYSTECYDVECSKCGRVFPENDTIAVKGKDGETKFYCIDDLTADIDWCAVCQEAYEIDLTKDYGYNVCPDCLRRYSM